MSRTRVLLLVATLGAATPAAAARHNVFEYFVAPSVPDNPRNSEADVLRLSDGRLLLAWTRFYTAKGDDWDPADIAARISEDGGRSWGPAFVLQENIGRMNVMEPDLLRLRSGKILFFFLRKNSSADSLPMLRISVDEARSFSAPQPLPIEPYPSYAGFNHDRAIQLSCGRVLMPVFFTSDYRVDPHIRSRVYYSDDEGLTWRASRTILDIPASRAGAQEPGVVELRDGRLLLWVRTDRGCMYQSFSSDRGETWTQPEPTAVISPLAPQSIKRIPTTGDLLLVWNRSEKHRFPLSLAVSYDEGRTWKFTRNLDEDPAHTYAYTSIEFFDDRALFTYYAGPPAGQRGHTWSLKLKSVPVAWLYGQEDRWSGWLTRAGFEQRRRETLSGMEHVMGALEPLPRLPVQVRLLEEKRESAFVRRKIAFLSEAGDWTPAWLLLPRARRGRMPAVLCLHQTTPIGKDEPAGLGGHPDLHYARELAERGYVTLAPDYPNHGEYKFDPYAAGYASAVMKGIRNHMRAVDLLASLPEVDAARIGVIGHSLGGHNALFLAAFDTRVRAVATSCGFTAFGRYRGGDLAGWSRPGYMPRIGERYAMDPARIPFDFPELLASLAPRPVFVHAPLRDDNFDIAGVRESLDFARLVYQKVFGAADRLVGFHPDGGHSFPAEARRQAYQFLDRWIGPQSRLPAELIEVRKIWDRAPHNAFTDLIRYRGRWWLAFREASRHVSPDGALRVLASPDGLRWEATARLEIPGRDLRDPKLAETPAGELMLTSYAVQREAPGSPGESVVWFSPDGRQWRGPERIGDPNLWLWRVTWHRDVAYAIGYNREITRLYASRDGRRFEALVPELYAEGYANESAIRFLPDGAALCLLRRDGGTRTALLGASRPPYTDWSWKDLGVRVGGPNLIRLPDGRWLAAVRLYDGRERTSLCWLDAEAGRLEEFLVLPSGGDTSYAGLVFHEGLLWVSYYSSHEGKSSIYVAKIRLR
ncbi:MAG: exo-alpha-sialidase [Bryobacterales bacterium]|nr:exo-alpha-sialidase [Bryobacteraceae bacterium]MDW8130367.1 exo-alpha-sialidase [Bryobacterales bacterium]